GLGDLVMQPLTLRIPKCLQESDQSTSQARQVSVKAPERVPPGDRFSVDSCNPDLHQALPGRSALPEHWKNNEVESTPPETNAEVASGRFEKMNNPSVPALLFELALDGLNLLCESEVFRAQ